MRRKSFSKFFKGSILEYFKTYIDNFKVRVTYKNILSGIYLPKIFDDIFSLDKNPVKERFQSFRERISSIEVQVEWKEVVEALLLTMLTMFLYMSVFLAEFSFIPLMIITIKRGWKETFFYLTWSMIVIYFLNAKNLTYSPMEGRLLLFSPLHYSFQYISSHIGIKGRGLFDYYLLYGVFGIFLGHLVGKNYKLRYIIFLSVLSYIGLIFITFMIASSINGFNSFIVGYYRYVDEATKNYINSSIAHLNSYRGLLATKGVDYLDFEKKLTVAAETYKKNIIFGLAPKGGYLIKQIVMVFLGVFFVKLYFRGKLKRAALDFDIIDYAIDDIWIWGLIFSWGLVYINLYLKNSILDIVAWNSAVIFSFLFFLRGISIVKLIVIKLGMPQFIQYVIFILLLVYSFILFIILITGLGVIDIWLYIKEKLQKIDEEND